MHCFRRVSRRLKAFAESVLYRDIVLADDEKHELSTSRFIERLSDPTDGLARHVRCLRIESFRGDEGGYYMNTQFLASCLRGLHKLDSFMSVSSHRTGSGEHYGSKPHSRVTFRMIITDKRLPVGILSFQCRTSFSQFCIVNCQVLGCAPASKALTRRFSDLPNSTAWISLCLILTLHHMRRGHYGSN